MTPRTFRMMVLGSWVLFAAYALSSALLKPTLPVEPRTYLDARAIPSWQVIMGLVVLILSIWNAIELFRFKRRARLWYIGLVAAGFLQSGQPAACFSNRCWRVD
jgi:hypothetical protein